MSVQTPLASGVWYCWLSIYCALSDFWGGSTWTLEEDWPAFSPPVSLVFSLPGLVEVFFFGGCAGRVLNTRSSRSLTWESTVIYGITLNPPNRGCCKVQKLSTSSWVWRRNYIVKTNVKKNAKWPPFRNYFTVSEIFLRRFGKKWCIVGLFEPVEFLMNYLTNYKLIKGHQIHMYSQLLSTIVKY